MGWLFLAASVGIAMSTASFNYVTLSLHRFALALPGTVFIAWLSSWIMIPTLISMVILVPLLFPTGHVASPRWRPVAIFGLVGICVTIGDCVGPCHVGDGACEFEDAVERSCRERELRHGETKQ